MACRQCDDLFALVGQQSTGPDNECTGSLAHEGRKCRIDVACCAGHQHDELQPEGSRSLVHRRHLCHGIRNVLVHQDRDDGRIWNDFVRQCELLRRQINSEKARSSDVPTRPVEARHDAGPDRVPAIDEDNGNGRRRRLGRQCRGIGVGHDHRDLAANQIGRQHGQLLVSPLRPAAFDRHVPALDVTGFVQALVECSNPLREWPRRHSA